jgi:hypothetical protein
MDGYSLSSDGQVFDVLVMAAVNGHLDDPASILTAGAMVSLSRVCGHFGLGQGSGSQQSQHTKEENQ